MNLKQIEVRLPARENECGQIVWLLKCCSKFFRPSTKKYCVWWGLSEQRYKISP